MTKAIIACVMLLAACGPQGRNGPGGDDGIDAPKAACVPSREICDDGIDNDCDGTVDCGDIDCSGVGNCPVCGQVNDPDATPIDLPDGVSSGTACLQDSDCPPATPNCIITDNNTIKECHASYTSTLNFVGFPAGATLTDTSKLLKVCVDIEHSYLHDLNFELLSPPDANNVRRKIAFQQFVGRVGPEIFLGIPNEADESGAVIPGTPWHYCFTESATVQMYNAAMNTVTGNDVFPHPVSQVPASDYKSMAPFAGLQGAPLNGTWTVRVTDMYAEDNGTLKGWQITFDPSLVADCSGPIIQ